MKAKAAVVPLSLLSFLSFLSLLAASSLAAQDASPEQQRRELIDKLAELRLDELDNPWIKTDVIPPVRNTPDNPHRLLILPVEYADRGFDRFAGEAEAAE